jgi:hypothetical protein
VENGKSGVQVTLLRAGLWTVRFVIFVSRRPTIYSWPAPASLTEYFDEN